MRGDMNQGAGKALEVTFGLPTEWESFKDRHVLFLDRFHNLEAALRIAFVRTMTGSEPLDRVIFFSGRLCAEELSEILLLCGNGYGVAALRLVRGMYERAVTARYLSEHPEEVDQFNDFHCVSQHRLMKAIEETFGSDLLGKEKTEEVRENFQRVKGQFAVTDCAKCGTTRTNHTWSKLDFVSMARKTGELGKLIVPAYYLPTKEAHSTIGAILSRLDPEGDGLVFDGGPQRKRADDALISAHNLILNALELQRDHFQLADLEKPLELCFSDFMDIWGTRRSAAN
jgi:hypothetical protein